MKICQHCGAWVRANAKFCTRCGAPLGTHTVTPKPPHTAAPTQTVSSTALQHELDALSSTVERIKAAYQAERQQSAHAQQQILQMQKQTAQTEQQTTAQLAQADHRIGELETLLEQAKQEILSLHAQLHEMYTQNQELHHALAQTSAQESEQTVCSTEESEEPCLSAQSAVIPQEQDEQDTIAYTSSMDAVSPEDEQSCEDELASTLSKVCDAEQTHD